MIDKPFEYAWFYSLDCYTEKPIRILYTIQNWYKNLYGIFRWLKWCKQRAFRGYADCDLWGMDYYLVEVILPMLKDFKKNLHGYPGWGEASTSEKWDSLIDEMIEGFEAAKRVCDDEYYKEVSGDSIEDIYNAPREEIEEWNRLAKEDQKLFEKKMKVFTKWFFHLWD